MDQKTLNDYKEGLSGIFRNINEWLEEGRNLIIALVKENGGFLPTIQNDEQTGLFAFYEDEYEDPSRIHGLHWDDELGLCLCTDEMLNNYTYDTGYYFKNYCNFEGEDLEHLGKALADPAYYVEWDRYGMVEINTLLSLLTGLPDYL